MKQVRLSVGAVLLSLAALIAGSKAALAQNIPGSVEITAIGGGYFGHQIFENLNTKVETATTYEYGARLGVNITEGIGIEAAWTYSKPDLNATRLTDNGVTGTIGQLKSNAFELDGLFSLGTDAASFYVVLSAGVTTLQPEIAGIQTNSTTNFSSSAGIGGKFWFGPHFGVRAEGRWRWVITNNTTDAGVWCDPFDVCYAYSTNVYGHPDLTAGLTVRF
jgi:hypothetical protein